MYSIGEGWTGEELGKNTGPAFSACGQWTRMKTALNIAYVKSPEAKEITDAEGVNKDTKERKKEAGTDE